MLLYYITDRKSFRGGDSQQRSALLGRMAAAASVGVDYIQLREKDLLPRDLEGLAREAMRLVRENSTTAKLLINSRTDIALACGADGVHLASGELAASEVRALWAHASASAPLIGVSAHSVAEVRYSEAHGADFAVLAPIFEKANTDVAPIGLETLQAACARTEPVGNTEAVARSEFAVLALGGVTLENASACMAAGAAGLAGIRLFQNGDINETVQRLREERQLQS
jgi:thiamine-phosphate pyrophosphorylase